MDVPILKLALRPILIVTSVWNTGETGDINSRLPIHYTSQLAVDKKQDTMRIWVSQQEELDHELLWGFEIHDLFKSKDKNRPLYTKLEWHEVVSVWKVEFWQKTFQLKTAIIGYRRKGRECT